jgi:dihydrofolate reductase
VNKVVWHVTMSVDGFIAGPDDAMGWAFEHGAESRLAEEVRSTTGSILAGRRWYDVATAEYEGVDGIYGGAWSGPVFVLTHRPSHGEADDRITFLSDGVERAVAVAGEAAGDNNLGVFGAAVATQVMAAGLLDEIVIHLAPVLLGDGVRLYDAPDDGTIELELASLERCGQLADLRYRVPRGVR